VNAIIETVLREHADEDIHIERLLTAVHAGARHRSAPPAVAAGAALRRVPR